MLLQEGNSEARGSVDDEHLDRTKSNELSSTSHTELYNRLRAVEIEIDAVANSVEQVKNFGRNDDLVPDGDDIEEQGDIKEEQGIVKASPNDLTLQHALAADRLRSLKKTKAQLEKEITNFDPSKVSKHDRDKVIRNLVKEEPKRKQKPKEVPKSSKNVKKRQKTVSFEDDDDFDSVLNAASAGFIETVS